MSQAQVVFAAELVHRGDAIKKALDQRRAVRRGRRQRKTRYRKPRFNNRRRKGGWIAPSLQSRVANVVTWTKRLMRLCPLGALSLELVKFDLQQLDNPEISGVHYQQGTLLATNSGNIFWRNGGGPVATVASRMCRCTWNTSGPKPTEGQIGSATSVWPAMPVIRPKAGRIFASSWLKNLICLRVSWLRPRPLLRMPLRST